MREHPLMTSDFKVGRESKIAPKMGRYRVGQGGLVKNGQKMWDVINGRSLTENW